MRFLRALLIATAIWLPLPAAAQTYPDRVIRLLVPNPAGGLGDLLGRTFGDYVTARTGQPVVIENRAGASGNVAWESTARSTPDGYTLALVNSGVVINRYLFKEVRYSLPGDLVPIAPIGDAPQLYFISTKLPSQSLPEFVAFAKAQSRKLTYGSAGVGSPPHLAGDQLGRRAGIGLVHVPYRGVAPAISDIVAGHVDSISVSIGPILPAVQAGGVRPLFALTPKRLPYFPDIPAAAEVGLPGLHMSTWFGLVAPKGTPDAIVDQLHGYVQGMLADATAQKRMADSKLDIMTMSRTEFAAFLLDQSRFWEQVVREAGAKGTE